MLLQAHEDIFMNEEPIFKTVGGDQLEVDPIVIVSIALDTMNEVTEKLYFYGHV